MHTTPEEASTSLAAIQQTQIRTRKATASWAYFLIIWGLFWIALTLLRQALPSVSEIWLWMICLVPCYVASGIAGRRIGTQMQARVPSSFGWLFTAPVGVGAIWLWLAWPLTPLPITTIVLLVFMTSYILAGIVLKQALLLQIGLTVSMLVLLAYLLGTYIAPAYTWLWQAVLQGGALLGSGIYALRRKD
jgi:hypothetical protein